MAFLATFKTPGFGVNVSYLGRDGAVRVFFFDSEV